MATRTGVVNAAGNPLKSSALVQRSINTKVKNSILYSIKNAKYHIADFVICLKLFY